MRIGVPTEVKPQEYRVAMTPAGVQELVRHGHDVVVQAGAGVGSTLPDDEFVAAGARILPDADAVWEAADLIVKSMEAAIGDKVVTYDFARLMDGATEVSCSAFGDAMIERM